MTPYSLLITHHSLLKTKAAAFTFTHSRKGAKKNRNKTLPRSVDLKLPKIHHVYLVITASVALKRQLRAVRRDCWLRVKLRSGSQALAIPIQIDLKNIRHDPETISGKGDAGAICRPARGELA